PRAGRAERDGDADAGPAQADGGAAAGGGGPGGARRVDGERQGPDDAGAGHAGLLVAGGQGGSEGSSADEHPGGELERVGGGDQDAVGRVRALGDRAADGDAVARAG